MDTVKDWLNDVQEKLMRKGKTYLGLDNEDEKKDKKPTEKRGISPTRGMAKWEAGED